MTWELRTGMLLKVNSAIVLGWKILEYKQDRAMFEGERTEIAGNNVFSPVFSPGAGVGGIVVSMAPFQIVTWGLPIMDSPEGLIK